MAEDHDQRKPSRPDRPDPDVETPPGLIPELLRKGLALGFSGLFMTEEAVRRAFGDTVPRDWIDFATEQSERTRSEFLERLSGEIARSLEALDLAEILDALMTDRTIEVRAEIRLGERRNRREASLLRFTVADRGKPSK
jgi:hypothetical protein